MEEPDVAKEAAANVRRLLDLYTEELTPDEVEALCELVARAGGLEQARRATAALYDGRDAA
ncbi:MAG: hypothetical protein K6T86_19830 [Pirellulales bacterium]|nr:hypothetical protein [Pirellulales bacterium]